jgi:cytochrome b involved in lipid metabolism
MAWLRRHQAMPQKPLRRLTMAEVGEHARPDDCWIVLHRFVYDVTPYLHYHPGGQLLRTYFVSR